MLVFSGREKDEQNLWQGIAIFSGKNNLLQNKINKKDTN